VDLAFLKYRRDRNDQRELRKLALKIVAHADYRAIAVADQDDLRCFIEELRIGFADIESAKCACGRRCEGNE
jgi:hypothetical protein